MSQANITAALKKLRYEGKYSITGLAKQSGFSRTTIINALQGRMTATTEVRLRNVIRNLPPIAPVVLKKAKSGRRKRFLLRFYNLRRWIAEVEYHVQTKRYRKYLFYPKTEAEAGYICCKMDYVLKTYLLSVFEDEIKKNRLTFGDCYSAEQWIEQICRVSERKDLCTMLTKRR